MTLLSFPALIRTPLPVLVTVHTVPLGRFQLPTGMHENGPTCGVG